MKSLRHIIAGLAFSAVLALSLAATAGDALAASITPDPHGSAIGRSPKSGTTLTPFDATGITWE